MKNKLQVDIEDGVIYAGNMQLELPEDRNECAEFMIGVKFALQALEQPYEITRIKKPETLICGGCSGSGEGMYENTTCVYCKGKGEQICE